MLYLRKIIPKDVPQSRQFWAWLNIIFNNVDQTRIKEVGPDLACAEWLLRNGASVKWLGGNTKLTNYNDLTKYSKAVHIQEVDATESSIMDRGFDHFIGCNHINKVIFHKCTLIDDRALLKLKILSKSLNHLQITSCGNITEKGLSSLIELKNLKCVTLGNLQYVRDLQQAIDKLKRECNCEVQCV